MGRPKYRKKELPSRASSFARSPSFKKQEGKNPPARSASFTKSIVEFKLLELHERLLRECKLLGENLILEGLITLNDIEKHKFGGGSRIISIGLPAYCILQALIRSANANSDGLLLSDNMTEITTDNRPKDAIFDWFFNPLMIIKEQIKAESLSEDEENYLRKLVLLKGDPDRLKRWNFGSPPENEQKRAELDALARRLQGITKSISRYPTFRRQIGRLVSHLSEELGKKNGTRSTTRSRSGLGRIISKKSLGNKANNQDPDQATDPVIEHGTVV